VYVSSAGQPKLRRALFCALESAGIGHITCYLQVAKLYAVQASSAADVKQAESVSEKGIVAVQEVLLKNGKGTIWELQQLAKKMRRVPQIDVFVPTVRPCTHSHPLAGSGNATARRCCKALHSTLNGHLQRMHETLLAVL
jgi:hypothetical protein